jgi:hypothetical protein
VESDFDFCARRAAEEFLAAGRASNPAERINHRQLAEKYAEVVRQLMQQRRSRGELPAEEVIPPLANPQSDAEAA